MHDAISAEREGTPALAVMTEKFVSAAGLMASVLGIPDYRFGVIDHPISSAGDAELAERAGQMAALLEELVVGKAGGDC